MATTGSNHQANNSIINLKGMVPELYLAALSGSFEDVSLISNWKEQATPNGNNILHVHLGKSLHKASKDGKRKISIKFIQDILNDDAGGLLLWKENDKGDTPLHLAARFGHTEVVKMFIEQAREVSQDEVTRVLRMTNETKDTALHEAARGGHADVVKLLVKADSNCQHEANAMGETPLYLAAERGNSKSVATMLDNYSLLTLRYDYKGPCGRTPLHAAVQWGNPEMVQIMMAKETSLIRAQDDEGLTPIHCAAAEISKYQHLKVLLNHEKKENNESSALYIRDKKGRAALHIATLRSNWEAIKKLTKCRPDCIEIMDNQGQNVVHYAAKSGCLVKLETLVEKEHFDILVNDKDIDGNTPLHLFAASSKLNHPCILRLPIFIGSNSSSLDLKAFNKQNLTVGDILASKLQILHPYQIVQQIRSWMAPRGKRMNTYDKDVVDLEEAGSTSDPQSRIESLRKAAQGQALVATLIATVSFAAGFTLPGGFNQNPGDKNIGMALLKNKTAFKIFLISDAIAFTCSTIAILSYFILVTTESSWSIESLSLSATILNTVSLGALMVAFNTGVSVVVSQSPRLIYALWAIALVFFFYYALLIVRTVRVGLHYLTRCSSSNHQYFK